MAFSAYALPLLESSGLVCFSVLFKLPFGVEGVHKSSIKSWMLTYTHSELRSNSCAHKKWEEKKIAPWYSEMPPGPGFCVAILHRKCVCSSLESDKWLEMTLVLQWMGREALDYFLPSIDGRRCSVFLRKMRRERELPCHTQGILKKEFPGALTEATAGAWAMPLRAGHTPLWWPSLALASAAQPGSKAIHASDSEMPGSIPHRHTLKAWVLLENGRLVREEKEILIRKENWWSGSQDQEQWRRQ